MKRQFIAFVVFLICFTAAIGAQDWRIISSISDLEGRWEGSFNMDVPASPGDFIPKSSINFKMNLFCTSSNYMFEISIDFEKLLDDFLDMPEAKGIGVTKELLWMVLVSAIEDQTKSSGFNFSTDGYTINMNLSGDSSDLISDSDEYFINESRNMIRIVFNEKMTLGLGDEGISEIILNKR